MPVYYVDIAVGSNTNSGLNPGAGASGAWQTINKAATTVVAGDIVHIKASAPYPISGVPQAFTNNGTVTNGPIIYMGYTTTPGANDGRPIITSSESGLTLFNISNRIGLCFAHLKFTHTGGTKGHAFASLTNPDAKNISIIDCHFDGIQDAVFAAYTSNYRIDGLTVDKCVVLSAAGNGFFIAGSTRIMNTLIKGCAGYAIQKSVGVETPIAVENCVIKNCNRGIYTNTSAAPYPVFVRSTVFHSMTNEAIYKLDTGLDDYGIENCVFHNNLYAIRMASGVTRCFNRNNCYGVNTNANVGWAAGENDQTITGDPWVDSANDNYMSDTDANQGLKLRNTGYPGVAPYGTGYADIGPLRHQDPAGGGGGAGIAILTGGGLVR